ncbi:MAG: DNA pilot protein [Arizlama microvirus]|nr:MAG: DNA pilot protein [Arizlama microvirus]
MSDFNWGGVAGGAIGGAFSYLGQSDTNSANSANFQQQMNFQQGMRATQYQTAVSDMKAAGLNPMLAYSQGGSTGGGNAPSAPVQTSPWAHAVTSALEGVRMGAEVAKIGAEIPSLESEAKIKAEAAKAAGQVGKGLDVVEKIPGSISDLVSQAVMAVEDRLAGSSAKAGDVLNRGAEALKQAPGTFMGMAQKTLQRWLSSASDAVSNARKADEASPFDSRLQRRGAPNFPRYSDEGYRANKAARDAARVKGRYGDVRDARH